MTFTGMLDMLSVSAAKVDLDSRSRSTSDDEYLESFCELSRHSTAVNLDACSDFFSQYIDANFSQQEVRMTENMMAVLKGTPSINLMCTFMS